MPIQSYLEGHAAFEPEAVSAMSQAFEQSCIALGITAKDTRERTVIATRIIELARTGEIDIKVLRNRVLLEAGDRS